MQIFINSNSSENKIKEKPIFKTKGATSLWSWQIWGVLSEKNINPQLCFLLTSN